MKEITTTLIYPNGKTHKDFETKGNSGRELQGRLNKNFKKLWQLKNY